MKKKVLVPYVEISSPRKRKFEVFSPDSSPETEPASPNLSPVKRSRLDNGSTVDRLASLANQRLALREEPTEPDWETSSRGLSPTVSDLGASNIRQLSPTISDFENGDDEGPPDLSYTELPSDPTYHEDDELEEDEGLEIEGETPIDEAGSGYDSDDVPVRIIEDYSIFNASTRILVPFGQLMELDVHKQKFIAAGRVNPYPKPDDDEIDGDLSETTLGAGERVKLSKILELNVHHYDDVDESFDRKIYIRTKFAWYILASPSAAYAPFFLPYFVPHQICHLYLSSCLRDPDMTREDFLRTLPDSQDAVTGDGIATVADVLGRPLMAEDVESDTTTAYLFATIPSVLSDSGLSHLKRVPLIANLLGADGFDTEYQETSENSDDEEIGPSTETEASSEPDSTPKPSRKGPKVSEKPSPFTPVVTPTVKDIAEAMFTRPLQLAGDSLAQFELVDSQVAQKMGTIHAQHEEDPKSMIWGRRLDILEESTPYFENVKLDGTEYRIGDVVMVHYDEDSYTRYLGANNYRSEASYSINSYANRVWFCKICYFFQNREGEKMCHVQWFHHGSKTILQETAHSRGLFLGETCNDVHVASIFQKCSVRMLEPGQDEIPDDEDPEGDEFFCSLLYDEDDFSFKNLPTEDELEGLLTLLPTHKPCYACAVREEREIARTPTRTGDSVACQGLAYHLFEFVYVQSAGSRLLNIVQIIEFENSDEGEQVHVRFLKRSQGTGLSQERRLVFTREFETIAWDTIDGKCYVKYFKRAGGGVIDWIKSNDHFWLNEESKGDTISPLKSSFEFCDHCLSDREEYLAQCREALDKHGPLNGMELFSGAGGLGTGFDMSKYVETKWAIEISGSAAKSYKQNHPDTTVYCQDSNALLRHAIDTNEGKKPVPLPSNYKDPKAPRKCEAMPRKGEVDIIYGGPPCQAFSRVNHSPKVDDPRTTLPTNMLSYLEFYQPDYFLLENVAGLLLYSCKATQEDRKIKGGIKMGIVKLIVRVLIALGYQACFKILQAGQYGCPQGRQRIIFWGAKRGLKLPNFPIPTHVFRPQSWKLPIDSTGRQVLRPASRCRDVDPKAAHACAPLRSISVNDAISDLPAFHWVNPHCIIQPKNEPPNDGIPSFGAVLNEDTVLPGYSRPTTYARDPSNAYQLWLRTNFTTNERTTKVTGQVTPLFTSRIVEATTTLPIKPLATHKELPLELWPNCAKPGNRQADKSFYGRLDGDGHFKTAMTHISPVTKSCYLIHPSQRRVVTYREAARAQGFPDHYQFLSEEGGPNKAIKDIYKQIGNAVPVPMAFALGLALGDALTENWRQDERAGSPEI